MHERLVRLTLIYQRRGTIDPGVPAADIAWVVSALGPAFLHHLALGAGIDAATFTRGLHALLPSARTTAPAREVRQTGVPLGDIPAASG